MNMKREIVPARRDSSELFQPVLLRCGAHTLNLLDASFSVSPQGMTFKTDSYFSPFTDLRVRLQLPAALGSEETITVDCDGVVVESHGSQKSRIYYVTVAFLNLSPVAQKRLARATGCLSLAPIRGVERASRIRPPTL